MLHSVSPLGAQPQLFEICRTLAVLSQTDTYTRFSEYSWLSCALQKERH